MGEEAKPEEQAPAETKPEEKPAEENPPPPPPPAEEKPPAEEEKKEEEPPQPPPPPPPFVLYVDLHCVGCAKKIERSIMKIRGVEGVVIDMAQNQVTIKGVVEPQAICNKIMKKTKRKAKVLSPLPANEGEPIPKVVSSQVSGLTTVELKVNMHCEACAGQLKKKILKMRGVQTAETELSGGKVIVTGTMDANKLVEYVYRRTKKQARIVPQPEPEKPAEEPKPVEAEKPADEPKPEENKEENNNAPQNAEGGDQNKPPEAEGGENKGGDNQGEINKEEVKKEEGEVVNEVIQPINIEEESMKRMMYNYYQYQQPLYVIERIPPPQLFSDENPNACCIS
ncbi:heavy metal-associated isoprenylated plant protein 9 isoform X2 [Beta vulgaris subsp. vulgaris]|uniref:heavy metal-associated isoprenylated plant protein 9 isoform X2 n=1 Tax=Beta vulgaris subsp. vulgaris TaxID=3555 RepID=UPI002036F6A6|nr:heavy metal-associated isoprenylated plant protein 9 isoform X2 [Beta vulgaris subsp. vulgaris]